MFESSKDQKPKIDTNQSVFDARSFFEAIPKDPEAAYAQLREQVPSHGTATPRAQELIDAGEWDSMDRFTIRCLKEGRCLGLVRSPQSGDSIPLRFCGRKLSECTIQGHRSSTWSEFQPGWFVPGGAKVTSGYYKSPRLPTFSEGGPVTQDIANALADATRPFELTLGQWRLVIDAWWEEQVKDAGDFGSFDTGDIGSTGPAQDDLSLFNKQQGLPSSPPDVKPPVPPMKPMPSLTPPPVGSSTGADSALLSQLGALQKQVAVLTAKLGMVQMEQSSAQRAAAAATVELQELHQRYRELQASQRTTIPPDAGKVRDLETMVTGLTAVCQEVRNNTVRLEGLVTDPTGPVEDARDKIAKLTQQVQMGGGVEAHGVRFRDLSEIKSWVSAVSDPLALFHDAVTLLHCIGANSVTHKDSLSMIKAQRDAKFNSDLEARVITSFRTKLPAIFYGAGTTNTTDEFVTLGSKLKTYADWHSPDNVSGVAQRIHQGLNQVHERVRQVSWSMTTHPEILRLSNGLLVDSINFINSLVAFVDMEYRDLVAGTYFTQGQVWEILVAIIERIFEDMRSARAPVQDIAMDADRSALLWGIMKSHEVMKRYMKNDFRNDPSIHGILVQKMLQCSPTSTITGKVVTLERSVTTITSKMNALTTKVNHLESKV